MGNVVYYIHLHQGVNEVQAGGGSERLPLSDKRAGELLSPQKLQEVIKKGGTKPHTVYEVWNGLDTVSDQQNNGGKGPKS